MRLLTAERSKVIAFDHAHVKLGLAGTCLLLGLSLTAHLARSTQPDGQRPEFVPPQEVDADSPSSANVSIERFEYSPYEIRVSPDTTVLWTNRDGVDHDVTFRDGELKSPLVGKGGKIAVMFKEPDEHSYYCHVHPFMQGIVVVE